MEYQHGKVNHVQQYPADEVVGRDVMCVFLLEGNQPAVRGW